MTGEAIMKIFEDMNGGGHITMITHDPEIAAHADRIVREGRAADARAKRSSRGRFLASGRGGSVALMAARGRVPIL